MRIIAGEFRSRVLIAPKSVATRPTTDRARESLFNVLSNVLDFSGIRVLDLYAGSGALAFEAISRGAKHATLIDRDRNAIEAIEKNAKSLQISDRISVVNADAIAFLKKNTSERFNLIFSDAPYDDLRARNEIPSLIAHWMDDNGLCVVEHRASDPLELPKSMERKRELKAGEASFTIFSNVIVSPNPV